MQAFPFPVTDNHIHIDPMNGRGAEAVKDFRRAGGTHMMLVTKPSWSLGVHPSGGEDFREVFDMTLAVAEMIRDNGVTVFPVLGVHPAEIGVLTRRMPLEEAAARADPLGKARTGPRTSSDTTSPGEGRSAAATVRAIGAPASSAPRPENVSIAGRFASAGAAGRIGSSSVSSCAASVGMPAAAASVPSGR